MKFYKVDLSSVGVKRKVVSIDGHGWELIHGQKMKENGVVRAFPQFFIDEAAEIAEVIVAPVESEKLVDTKTINEQKADNTPAETIEKVIEEEVKVEELNVVVNNKVEDTTEEVVEAQETTESVVDVDGIIAEAKKFRSKTELEEFGLTYGIDLNKQKNMKNMIKDLEAFLRG